MRLALAVAAMLLAAASARAAEPVSVTVSDFGSADPALAAQARGVGILVATRLAHRPGVRLVGTDQVAAALALAAGRAVIGDESADAPHAVAAVLGAKWILRGQVDRYGRHFVLSAVLLDAQTAQATARFRVDAAEPDDLPAAADRMGDQIAVELGLPAAQGDAELVSGHEMIGGPIAFLSLKLGQAFAGLQGFSLGAFTLNVDLEGDVVLKKWLLAYFEVGVLVGQAKSDATQNQGIFSLVPAGAGCKFIFRSDAALRPFIGLGVGLGFFAALIDSTKGVALRVDALTGVLWMPWERVGVVFELRGNVDTQLLYGFSWNFGATFAF
jgi:TolB-like protein